MQVNLINKNQIQYNRMPQKAFQPAFGAIIKNNVVLPLKNEPVLCILSGPSGAGKDSVLSRFNQKYSFWEKIVTCTTRPMRKGEVNGIDYHFLTADEFTKGIKDGDFLEYENVYADTFYGTRRTDVEKALNSGKSAIMVIDVNGAANIKQKIKDAVSVFILPPSLEELAQRLIKRGSESEKTLQVRLAKADWEISRSDRYDVVIRNDNIFESADELARVFGLK